MSFTDALEGGMPDGKVAPEVVGVHGENSSVANLAASSLSVAATRAQCEPRT